jgi:hypothetical protein
VRKETFQQWATARGSSIFAGTSCEASKSNAKRRIDPENIKGAETKDRKQKWRGDHRQRDSDDPLRPIEGRQLPVECLETVLVGELAPV